MNTTTHLDTTALLCVAERLWFSSVELEAVANTPGSDGDLLRTISVELRRAARASEKNRARDAREAIDMAEHLCDSIQNQVYRRKTKAQIIALRSM